MGNGLALCPVRQSARGKVPSAVHHGRRCPHATRTFAAGTKAAPGANSGAVLYLVVGQDSNLRPLGCEQAGCGPMPQSARPMRSSPAISRLACHVLSKLSAASRTVSCVPPHLCLSRATQLEYRARLLNALCGNALRHRWAIRSRCVIALRGPRRGVPIGPPSASDPAEWGEVPRPSR